MASYAREMKETPFTRESPMFQHNARVEAPSNGEFGGASLTTVRYRRWGTLLLGNLLRRP
ncbi:MAG: hypothetical protein EAZ24_06340 [Burkholderiales bacterium]|nr:MAG: hypothetical protein EAZ21_14650 [Betaproteobacteria bacterium]TAG78858.1 MAG: hypothetical protein EAZ24_06340 [Burkholderiales bacterium]